MEEKCAERRKKENNEKEFTILTSDLPTNDSLPRLLAALAAGARAVQELPLSDDFDFQSSFPEFSKKLSDTQNELVDTIATILKIAKDDDFHDEEISQQQNRRNNEFDDIDDPMIWESCADTCDALIEKVEIYLQQDTNKLSMVEPLTNFSGIVRQRAQSTFGRLAESTIDMKKPQLTFGIEPVQKNRVQPFVPKVHPNKPYALTPLDISLHKGHGLDTRFGNLRTYVAPEYIIAPDHHVPHVYLKEIESFQYQEWQLQYTQKEKSLSIKKLPPISIVEPLQASWIDTVHDLKELAQTLQSVSIIAVDLEAHSYRSFAGITCLMQISIRSTKNISNDNSDDDNGSQNYLIDILKLWNHINTYLAPIFANPAILKVMHGADSDIPWLQRDFGIFVVNMFDTGRAARALKFPSAGLAFLLTKYVVGSAPDKTHQLSDWRQRPIPDSMKKYAIMDTHYLLDIFDRLLLELELNKETSVKDVLDISRQVCSIRFTPEPFNPNGYKRLINMNVKSRKSGKKTKIDLNSKQENVLSKLWDWRDQTARLSDESLLYVCSNQALLRISLSCPSTVAALQALLNPIPPLVLRHSQDILNIIKTTTATKQQVYNDTNIGIDGGKEIDNKVYQDSCNNGDHINRSKAVETPSSVFYSPAEFNEKPAGSNDDMLRRAMLSPVLGTEALYKQAGWVTPLGNRLEGSEDCNDNSAKTSNNKLVKDIATTTGSEDCGDDCNTLDLSKKPRNLLLLNTANKNYLSKQYSDHTLEMGAMPKVIENDSGSQNNHISSTNIGSRGRTSDGMGAAMAAITISTSSVTSIKNGAQSIPAESSLDIIRDNSAQVAQQIASQIRKNMSEEKHVLGLIPTDSMGDELYDGDSSQNQDGIANEAEKDNNSDDADEEQDEENFIIPRSMREIYMISNRNRRNKKIPSPTPDRVRTREITTGTEDELAKAEEVLKSRGAYFYAEDGNTSPDSIKRQRTKSSGTESEVGAAIDNMTRDDDIAFMQSIGWVKDKKESETLVGGNRRTTTNINDNNNEGVDSNINNSINGVGGSCNGGSSGQQQRQGLVNEKASESLEINEIGGNGNVDSGVQRDSSIRSKQTNLTAREIDDFSPSMIGGCNPSAPHMNNPFFIGAAISGGPLAENFAKPEKKRNSNTSGRSSGGRSNRKQQERAEKRGEGRTHVYKKK